MLSKLSVHDLSPNGEAMHLIRAKCAVVKSVDDSGLILEAMSLNLGAIFIMRFNDPQLSVEQCRKDGLSPAQAVERWWNAYKTKIELNPHLKHPRCYLEGYNEPVWKKPNPLGGDDIDDIEGMKYYGQVEKLRVEFLASLGYLACIGNFSVGYPHIAQDDISWWLAFEPAIDAGIAHESVLGIHCYSWRDLLADQSNSNRQKMIYEWYLKPRGKDIKIVVTEFGLLYYLNNPRVSDEEYIRQLIAYDDFAMHQEYLLGLTLFAFGDTGKWPEFRISDGIARGIAEHLVAVAALPTPPPNPVPPPTPPLFNIGDDFEVIADPQMRLRQDPAGTFRRWIAKGATAVVTNGPIDKAISGTTQVLRWWKSTLGGWLAESQNGVVYLRKFIPPPPIVHPNLLLNFSFAGGVRPVQPPFISGAWPNDWTLDWFYTPADPLLGTGTTWTLAEMIVIKFLQQFPEDAHRFDKSDDFIFDCFWAYGALGFGWKQTLDIPAGQYRFLCPVKPNQWHRIRKSEWESIKRSIGDNWRDHPNQPDADNDFWQVRPSGFTSSDWSLSSEVYADIDTESHAWLDAVHTPVGQYTVLTREINHPGGPLTVRFGARGRWPFITNGWMFDGLQLTLV